MSFIESRITWPCANGAVVTPSDTVDLDHGARCVYVGTGGNVAAVLIGGTVLTFTNVPNGAILPIQVKRINSTNTTASNILALR